MPKNTFRKQNSNLLKILEKLRNCKIMHSVFLAFFLIKSTRVVTTYENFIKNS